MNWQDCLIATGLFFSAGDTTWQIQSKSKCHEMMQKHLVLSVNSFKFQDQTVSVRECKTFTLDYSRFSLCLSQTHVPTKHTHTTTSQAKTCCAVLLREIPLKSKRNCAKALTKHCVGLCFYTVQTPPKKNKTKKPHNPKPSTTMCR